MGLPLLSLFRRSVSQKYEPTQRLKLVSSMAPLHSLSRDASYSSAEEFKVVRDLHSKEFADVEVASFPQDSTRRPLWKRVLTGDAGEGYEPQRAMTSRHITMIGRRQVIPFPPLSFDYLPLHSHRGHHWHWHFPQCGVCEYSQPPLIPHKT